MKEQNPNTKRTLVVLLVLNLALSAVLLSMVFIEKAKASGYQVKYTLYMGLNDKDTHVQELSLEESKAIVADICLKHVSGFTLTEADGGWTDDAGNAITEKSLVCVIHGATADEIDAIVAQALEALNQSTILVEHQRVRVTYPGSE